MSKRKKIRRPNISPATMLRPRLDSLWADDALLHKEDATIEQDLDVVARDVAPDFLLTTLLRAYLSASAAVRARLDAVLPGWLGKHGYMNTLQEMVADASLDADLRPPALGWMEAAGIDTKSFESVPNLFLRAYYYDDVAVLGEKSQAYVAVLWYTSPKRNRAQGMGFLLDYNPPWDGSVKDILVTKRRPPRKLFGDFSDVWNRSGMELETVSAERAKTVVLAALNCNRAANLRLPRDLIAAREFFVRYVLPLPDAPDTPSFTMDDFDFLARHGERPEEVMDFEQTVGRRVRMEDGREVLVMGGSEEDGR
jgi:hypothetical protein